VAIGAALWGLHLALTQGLFAALVADTCTEELRGSAFGLFSFATGIAILLASLIAGALWDQFGSQATFLSGAGFGSAALIGGLWVLKRIHPQNDR
jgi:MFS family permease